MMEKKSSINSLREKMFHEIKDKSIFNQVKDYAFEYADNSLNRSVFPTRHAIEGLKVFDEELPSSPNSPEEVLKQLHEYGSPATVLNNGGRYFGFVIGGTLAICPLSR